MGSAISESREPPRNRNDRYPEISRPAVNFSPAASEPNFAAAGREFQENDAVRRTRKYRRVKS